MYVQIIPGLPKPEASSIETLLDQRFRVNNDGSGSSSIMIGYAKEYGDQRNAMKRFYRALEKADLASRGMTDDSSD